MVWRWVSWTLRTKCLIQPVILDACVWMQAVRSGQNNNSLYIKTLHLDAFNDIGGQCAREHGILPCTREQVHENDALSNKTCPWRETYRGTRRAVHPMEYGPC